MENNSSRRCYLCRRHGYWIGIVIVVIFRMALVSQDEIVAVQNDSLNYARQATYYLTDSVYGALPKNSPGLSMAAIVANELGVPYKLCLDVLLLVTALACSYVLAILIGSRMIAFLLFVLLMLNPWFFSSNLMFMSEPLTAIILMCLLLSACQFLFVPVRRWSIWGAIAAGFVSAAYVLTRPETLLLLLFWFLVLLAAILCQWRTIRRLPKKSRRLRLAMIIVPAVFTIGVTHLVKSIHLNHYGVYALTVTDAPGFKSLMNALYTIPPEQQTRFAPVTRQSMSVACDASPTLASYRDRLLDLNSTFIGSAERQLGLENEFGTWLNWHLVWAFRGVNEKSNKKMQRAADEIRQAQQDGRLKYRYSVYPIDPLWRQWIVDLPSATMARLAKSVFPGVGNRFNSVHFRRRRIENPVDQGHFDTGLLRRIGIGETVTIRLYAKIDQTGYRRARLISRSGAILDDTRISRSPDSSFEFGFVYSYIRKGIDANPAMIELIRHEDPQAQPLHMGIRPNMKGLPVQIDPEDIETKDWWISATTTGGKKARQANWKRQIKKFYPTSLVIVMLFAFLYGAVCGIKPNRLNRLFWFVLVGAGFVAGRSFFYSLVEVWLNWGEYRYVEPNCLVATIVLVCGACVGGAMLNRRLKFLRNNRFSRFTLTVRKALIA